MLLQTLTKPSHSIYTDIILFSSSLVRRSTTFLISVVPLTLFSHGFLIWLLLISDTLSMMLLQLSRIRWPICFLASTPVGIDGGPDRAIFSSIGQPHLNFSARSQILLFNTGITVTFLRIFHYFTHHWLQKSDHTSFFLFGASSMEQSNGKVVHVLN
jgi:hypothetical protein